MHSIKSHITLLTRRRRTVMVKWLKSHTTATFNKCRSISNTNNLFLSKNRLNINISYRCQRKRQINYDLDHRTHRLRHYHHQHIFWYECVQYHDDIKLHEHQCFIRLKKCVNFHQLHSIVCWRMMSHDASNINQSEYAISFRWQRLSAWSVQLLRMSCNHSEGSILQSLFMVCLCSL